MAEVNAGGKKVSTKVDMTPMVDLGFLLITFFILTTSMSKPKRMELAMPDKNEDPKKQEMKVKESHTVTILLDEKDKIYWYRGMLKPDKPLNELKKTDFSKIRNELVEVREKIGTEKDDKGKVDYAMIVVVKPTIRAKYRNIVDMLDEMAITNIQRYAIVDITKADETYLVRYLREYGSK